MPIICEHCNKEYASYSSRSNHIKKYHKEKDNEIIKCEMCNKIFTTIQSKKRHIKNYCKEREKENKILELEQKIINMEQIQNNLLQNLKIQNNTNKNDKIINDTINNNIVNINNINNTINIIPFGNEKLHKALSQDQKLQVLNAKNSAHIELSNMIYSDDEFKKFRNIIISNLSHEFCKVYDNKMKEFITKLQKNIIRTYADHRLWDIEAFYDELKNELDDFTTKKIETLIKDYFHNEKFNIRIKKELSCNLYDNRFNVIPIFKSINKN